jgi:hypothetical protein
MSLRFSHYAFQTQTRDDIESGVNKSNLKPLPIPTIVSYNPSIVKIYNATGSLVLFKNNCFLLLWKTL